MSIWCSYPTIGWDNLGDPEPGWSSGEVRSYADGWSNHYPDGTAEHPGSIDLASIAPWCVPGWWERSDNAGWTLFDAELDREVGPWLRLGVHSPHAVTYWRKDAEGNPTPNPEAATVVLDVAAVQALYDQLGRWLAAEKIAPAEETDPATVGLGRPESPRDDTGAASVENHPPGDPEPVASAYPTDHPQPVGNPDQFIKEES